MTKPNCIVPECEKPSRSNVANYCPMHYHRQYRHGSVDAQANESGVTVSHGRRYRQQYRPGHPVADKAGKVYIHRAVLHDLIGPGPHPCHWCALPVDWTVKGSADCLHVDHLNDVGDDNRAENLVPSCARCNTARGSARRRQALLAAGWWSEHDTIARLRDPSRRRRAA
jgi:hypothetical protein